MKIMRTMLLGCAAAAAITAAALGMTTPVQAKPLSVCFKTADGKHYLQRGRSGGHLQAVATRCKGDAVFVVHEAKDQKRAPRFGKPVALKAKKAERYVWMSHKKKTAFASKKALKMRDKRFFFQINRASGGGGGAPISVGDRVSIKSYVKGVNAYVSGGGGESISFGTLPKHKAKWGTFLMVKAQRR